MKLLNGLILTLSVLTIVPTSANAARDHLCDRTEDAAEYIATQRFNGTPKEEVIEFLSHGANPDWRDVIEGLAQGAYQLPDQKTKFKKNQAIDQFAEDMYDLCMSL